MHCRCGLWRSPSVLSWMWTRWEGPLTCLKDDWKQDFLKLCSSTVQQTCLCQNLMFTEDLTNKGADTCVGMQIDVCYPVLIRPSPICLAFAVFTKPLSPRCGQGSCYPEPVAVWNRGWHIRAPGALSLWGSVAMPLWMIGTRGKETGSWTQ